MVNKKRYVAYIDHSPLTKKVPNAQECPDAAHKSCPGLVTTQQALNKKQNAGSKK
jgi:hypothetical protein